MKILIASAPADYGYINLCYRYVELGEVASYLSKTNQIVGVLDGMAMKDDWETTIENTLNKVDAVILHHSGENVESTCKTVLRIRERYPNLPVATYGIVSIYSARLFEDFPFDAIVIAGDWEAVLADWLESLRKPGVYLAGIEIYTQDGWMRTKGEKRLASQDWGFPKLEMLPLSEYRRLYAMHPTVAGVKGTFELSLSISRGCPYVCWYCPVPQKDGIIERRRPVQDVIKFLQNSIERYAFDQISYFSPCFTLDREWVIRFCDALLHTGISVPWRCVTTQTDIDDELIERMASTGCWRIGIGIETLNPNLHLHIGKSVNLEALPSLIQRLRHVNIVPMCFLLDGLPGQQPSEVEQDARRITELGSDVRISKLILYGSDTKRVSSFAEKRLAREVVFVHAGDNSMVRE